MSEMCEKEKQIQDERHCKYVCSRGIMKSCDIHSSEPHSSIRKLMHLDFRNIKAGQTVYICGSAIPEFATIVERIREPFILVTGDCDETCPSDLFMTDADFVRFIEQPKIIRWYSQNAVGQHPKFLQIPIGLDYHTMAAKNHEWGDQIAPKDQEAELEEVKQSAKPLSAREVRAYSNFHFSIETKFGDDRKDALASIPVECMFYEPVPVKRCISWENQAKYAFVVSPHGNGLDCHRTWEALALGCIPIVKSSPLDPLYADLPVWVVQEWSDVTLENMQKTLDEYKGRTFCMERLTLSYWMSLIQKGA